MKRESRKLFLHAREGLLVGAILRGESFDKLIVRTIDEDLMKSLSEEKAMREVRRVLATWEAAKEAPLVVRALGAELGEIKDLAKFLDRVALETGELAERLRSKESIETRQ
ncbi:MAG: hypothetical protein QXU52_04230 [Fervidicoccaceae archaeon]